MFLGYEYVACDLTSASVSTSHIHSQLVLLILTFVVCVYCTARVWCLVRLYADLVSNFPMSELVLSRYA